MNQTVYPSSGDRLNLGSVPAMAQTAPQVAQPVAQPAPQGGLNLGQLVASYAQGHQENNNHYESALLHGNLAATNSQSTSTTQFFLEYINLQETPGYLDHFNRHYIPQQQTDYVVNDLVEDLHRSKGALAPSTLATHASRMYGYNMEGGSNNQIYIPQGFRTKRAKFLMLVREVDRQFNHTRYTYLNGFTDRFGISQLDGRTKLDEDMQFYINSIVTLAEENHVDPSTGALKKYWNVVQASQVVDGQLVGMDPTTGSLRNTYMLRPQDLVSGLTLKSTEETGQKAFFTLNGLSENVGGFVSHFNHMGNNLPSTYLQRLITPVVGGISELGDRPGMGGMLSSMASLANQNEFSIQNCAFLRYMTRNTGVPVTSCFTISMLKRLDDSIAQRITYRPVEAASYANMNAMSLDSTPWNYVGMETEVATKVATAIAPLLYENFAVGASFSITNRLPNRLTALKWSYLQFVTPTGLPVFQKKLENSIKEVMMVDATRAGQIITDIDVFCDIQGETVVQVRIDSPTPFRYTTPSFAGGIINPIHTNNTQVSENIITGFSRMVDGIRTLKNSKSGINPSNVNYSF